MNESTEAPQYLKLVCDVCQEATCFTCGQAYHCPATCDQVAHWEEKSQDDSETKNWLQANTKPCPQCKTPIEKDNGCNHMKCRKPTCRFEFCWLCLQHTTSHTGHANCDKVAFERMQSTANKSKSKLDRYLHYFNVSSCHQQSLKY